MMTQIKTLSKLEIVNIYGLNVFRFSKDRKAKRKAIAMMIVWGLLIAMLFMYVGGLSYGLIQLGLEDVVPAYMITISSLLIFFMGIFKAGSIIFRKNGYDILCSLPVSQNAIVISRFLRMYVENLVITIAVLLPGFAVYVWFVCPGVTFCVLGAIGVLFIPIVPMAIATLIGALVTGISSRMKHKSLVAAGLSISVVLALMLASSQLSVMEGSVSTSMLKELSGTVLALLERVYPPAVWFGMAMVNGDFIRYFMSIGLFLAIFFAVAIIVSTSFHTICRSLYSTSAKHDYRMEKLKKDSVLSSLCKREFKRYFSSSVYVTNTIIGPIMGVVFSGALLFVGTYRITELFPVSIDLYDLMPFVLAGIFCIMTTTSTSISMEGKNWWILKSLPLTSKNILDAKILMNLILMLPFYLLSEVLLILALKPGITDILWLLLLPGIIILFSCVYGITINLYFPILDWESEVRVVKQSASAMLGGMGGFLISIICVIPVALLIGEYSNVLKFIICACIFGITALLYQKNSKADLRDL